jgi:hypothetical protein
MLGIIIKTSKSNKIKGLRSMFVGDECTMINFEDLQNIDFDFFVQNGMKKKSRSNNEIYEFTENSGKPVLIREAPVLRMINNGSQTKVPFEKQWNRFSWNSFFVDEGLHPYDPSYNRWDDLSKKFDIKVHDWKRRGDAVLFNLQKDGDSALNRLTYNGTDYKDFILRKIKQAQTITDRPIIVRSHPLDSTAREYIKFHIRNVEFSQGRTLYEDLDRAWCMITYNSTSCVESSLYGTPTIVLDPSAVSTDVSQTKLEQIEDTWEPDRVEWCKRIAFMQWQGIELLDGYVWNLLKSLVWK